MFEISFGELILLGLLFLYFFDSKKMPSMMRDFGKFVGRVRNMMFEAKEEVNDAMSTFYDAKDNIKQIESKTNDELNKEIKTIEDGLKKTPRDNSKNDK